VPIEATGFGDLDHVPALGLLDRPLLWSVHVERAVASPASEVLTRNQPLLLARSRPG